MIRPDPLTAVTYTLYTAAAFGLTWLLLFFLVSSTPARSAPPAPDGLVADRTVDRTSRSAARVALPSQGSPAHQTSDGRGGDLGKVSHPARPALPEVLRCIRAHESGGNYQAFNGIEHYGAWQLSARYSPTWARRYGVPQFAGLTADKWPRWAQDKVAVALFAAWPGAWSTYGACS